MFLSKADSARNFRPDTRLYRQGTEIDAMLVETGLLPCEAADVFMCRFGG
jgi:hypothetical protein